MLPVEQVKNFSEICRDGVCQAAQLILEGQEKMIRLNIGVVEELMKQSGAQFAQTLTEMAQMDPVVAWPGLLDSGLKSSIGFNLTMIRTVSRWNKDLASTVQTQLGDLSSVTMDEIAKYNNLGRKIAIATIQTDEHQGHRYRRLVA